MAEILTGIRKHKTHRMNPNSLKNLEGHRFEKGKVSNPNGGPPKALSITASLRMVSNLPISSKVDMSKLTFAQAAAYVHWQKAVKGNQEAYEFITNRLEGKPQDKVDVTSKGESIGNGDDIRAFITSRIASLATRGGADGDNIQSN